MNSYDNNIDLFDAYLNNTMSEQDRHEFESRLAQDDKLMREFTSHKELVYMLQKSCSEADQEFEQALKGISDEDFLNIVKAKKTDSTITAQEKPKGRIVPFNNIYRWMSAAAVLLLIVSIGNNIFTNARLDNMKDAYCNQVKHYYSTVTFEGLPGESRDGDQEAVDFGLAVQEISDGNSSQGISMLEKLYKNASTPERKELIGTQLVYAYIIGPHDLDAAKGIIDDLKKDNNDVAPSELKEIADDLKSF